MNYWLVKFAPFRCSWGDILRKGYFEIYSVRNYQSRNNLLKMELHDIVLYYHSQSDMCVLGVMKVIETAHQDPTTIDNKWVSVTFEPIKTIDPPIPLVAIKAEVSLQQIGLVKQQRLAVMELTQVEYEKIISIGSVKNEPL